jgi:poly-beta-1,6-N-acetyl-D-glucosamine synthase
VRKAENFLKNQSVKDKGPIMLSFSLGIIAYGEEHNIQRALDSILSAELGQSIIKEIIVVVDEKNDKTSEIVRLYATKISLIKPYIRKERQGKASAINIYLSHAQGDICVLVNADVILDKNALSKLIQPFFHPHVGMTGIRPVSINRGRGFIGCAVKYMWELHHEISLQCPKLGECIAFRNIIANIPDDTITDEATIEAIIVKKGYSLYYVPEAIGYIRIAKNIRDFLSQRRRIASGHLWLRKKYGYTPSTRRTLLVLKYLLNKLSPQYLPLIFFIVSFEIIARLLSLYDFYIQNADFHIWPIAESTKSRF